MQGISNAVWQLITLFGPLIFCVVALQFFERQTQKRMTRHFGWRSNLWTGWIGAPVHEYSHALVAKLFGLKVEKVVPFQPEKETGRLGYVTIGYNPNSTWQCIGHFFVCYAPLVGGTLALLLVTALFYPSAFQAEFRVTPEALSRSALKQAFKQLGNILTVENMATARFWIFSYLVLSIGCHLAPSSADYRASVRGHGKVGLALLILVPLFILLGGFPEFILSAIAPVFLIIQSNFIFAVLLCFLVLAIVYVVTELITWLS